MVILVAVVLTVNNGAADGTEGGESGGKRQWEVFIIPIRAHPKVSKGGGDQIFSALVAFGVRSKTSKFEDLIMFRLVNRNDQKVYFSHILA